MVKVSVKVTIHTGIWRLSTLVHFFVLVFCFVHYTCAEEQTGNDITFGLLSVGPVFRDSSHGFKDSALGWPQTGNSTWFRSSSSDVCRAERAASRQALRRFREKLRHDPQLLRKYKEKQTLYNRRYREKQKLMKQGFVWILSECSARCCVELWWRS